MTSQEDSSPRGDEKERQVCIESLAASIYAGFFHSMPFLSLRLFRRQIRVLPWKQLTDEERKPFLRFAEEQLGRIDNAFTQSVERGKQESQAAGDESVHE